MKLRFQSYLEAIALKASFDMYNDKIKYCVSVISTSNPPISTVKFSKKSETPIYKLKITYPCKPAKFNSIPRNPKYLEFMLKTSF